MCGIAGILWRDAPADVERIGLAGRLDAALAHRGPDGAGRWASGDGRLLLVHRRLAIIDPTPAAAQPMLTDDAGAALAFNGEVYNYRELRSELESRGEKFRTSGDTEVLLRLIASEGPASLARVRGMFALAFWNIRDGSLLVARDRFGIKPLYVAETCRSVAFASELHALRAGRIGDGAVSAAGVLAFLSWGSIPPPLTWIDGVEMLPPGAWRRWSREGRRTAGTFADVRTAYVSNDGRALDRETFRHEVADAVRDSVRAHLVSDVPVGVFLSGGIDSSAIVSAVRAVGAGTLRTFTVGFDDRTTETALARTVACEFDTEHHDLMVEAPEIAAEWPRILAHLDQPTIDAVNSYYVSKAVAATGIKSVLSGIGGDELFGGYPSFSRLPRAAALKHALGPAFHVLAPLASIVMPPRLRPRWDHFSIVNGEFHEAYRVQRGFLLPAQIAALAGPRLLDPSAWRPAAERLAAAEDALCAPAGEERPAAAVARLETRVYLGSQLLRDIDATAMAHGLEVRLPFVDHQLVGRVWPELGRHSDLRTRKRLLVGILDHPLPSAIVRRRKQGFTLPFARWIAGDLKPVVAEGLDALASDGWIRPDVPERVWADWREHRAHWSQPWGLAVLGHFLRGAARQL